MPPSGHAVVISVITWTPPPPPRPPRPPPPPRRPSAAAPRAGTGGFCASSHAPAPDRIHNAISHRMVRMPVSLSFELRVGLEPCVVTQAQGLYRVEIFAWLD